MTDTSYKLKAKHRMQDKSARAQLAKRQERRGFIEQLDEFVTAVNGNLTGSVRTVHNKTIAGK